MSNYVESSSTNLAWAMPLMRTGKFPLDRSDLFSSYTDAVKYAAGNTDDPDSRGLCGTSYVGQIIVVFENDIITCYVIDANRGLQSIGSGSVSSGSVGPATTSSLGTIIVGDNLAITEEGVLSVLTANEAEEDNTRPITAAAVQTELGNISVLLETI